MHIKIGKLLVFTVLLFMVSCSNQDNNPVISTEEPSDKTLVVTEIFYNSGVDTLEFIEIKNVSATQQSLKGMFFSKGIDFKFPDNTELGKGQYLVLTNSLELFTQKYQGVTIAGVYSGKLNNSGDGFKLFGADSQEVFSVAFGTSGFWPALADGLGRSLVTINESDVGDQNDYNDWIASANAGGSPGSKDQAKSFSSVYVNEVMVSSLTDRKDKIELFNPSLTDVVDVSYFYITDDRKTPKKFQLPAGSVIQPNSYVVISNEQFKDSLTVSTGGGSIYLFGANADGNLTGFSHGIDFEDATEGTTCGLIKNSDGNFFTSTLKTATIGSANSDAQMGSIVISEIMYHPADGGAEYIEIANLSADSVPLFSSSFSWKVEGISFEFPPKTTLQPNAVCLLIDTSFSVSEFKSKYAIDPTVLIFQFDGKLSNDSEMVAIAKPGKTYLDANDIMQCPYITVDAVSYNDRSPWPRKADGDGYSLIRRDLAAWGNEPSN
ncbi:MAG TPA: lamin tail domain-containing protein, partial [Chitinispirillaceae bacterium]|nr:lamin tail domain-containing protein [Chitinispirillaceae bacterium]